MRENLRSSIFLAIRRMIMLGEVRPGERLNVAQLARQLGVSHIPVREAVSQLQKDGLVEIRAGEGAFARGQDARQSFELFQIRIVLEGEAAAAAARRAAAGDVEHLREPLDVMRRVVETVAARGLNAFDEALMLAYFGADVSFHRRIIRLSGNLEMLRALGQSHNLIRVHGIDRSKVSARFVEDTAGTQEEHQAIFDAIAARDPRGARAAMRKHLRQARRAMLRRLSRPESGGRWSFPPAMFDVIEQLESEDRAFIDAATGGLPRGVPASQSATVPQTHDTESSLTSA